VLNLVHLADLVIANGGTDSNNIEVDAVNDLCIFAPATLTGTINVQVSPDASNWFDLKSGGSNVAVAASAAVVITNGGFKYLRVHSGSAEGAARTFNASMQERT